MTDWIEKCPKCGTHLPEPVFEEVRRGGAVWAWVSKCPKEDCGYLFAQTSKRLTKYPSFMEGHKHNDYKKIEEIPLQRL